MMFLHVGNNRNIRIRDVVGIFDMDNATVSSITRKFLSGNQKKHLVESAAEEIPKSFVLYRDGESFIAAIFPMNEDSEEEFYTVQISWIVDDEDDRILFRAERVLQEVNADDESELLRFCNEWNKKYLYGKAVYDNDNGGLHLDHTLPLPDRVSDMFLEFQVYHHLQRK